MGLNSGVNPAVSARETARPGCLELTLAETKNKWPQVLVL